MVRASVLWDPRVPCFYCIRRCVRQQAVFPTIQGKTEIRPAPDSPTNPQLNPLHIHSPPAPGMAFDCVARSWGRGWPGACEGPPGGLGLDASEDGARLSSREQEVADQYQRPSTGSGRIGISALRQAQGAVRGSPFDRLRAHSDAPSTSSPGCSAVKVVNCIGGVTA